MAQSLKNGEKRMPRGSNLEGRPGPGRPKGCPNKATLELKEMIEKALQRAGGIGYLEQQAKANPSAFLALLAKLLPRDLNISGNVGVDLMVTALEAGRARLLAARAQTLPEIEPELSLPAAPTALPDVGETLNQD